MLRKLRLNLSYRNLEYFRAFIIVTILAVFESRSIISQLPSYVGRGEFKYSLIPFSLKSKFHYLPLLILDNLSLPTPYSLGILHTFYHALGAFFMFVFAKEYLKHVFPENSDSLLPPYISMLVYMFYPYNIMGDAFSTLILVRSLVPLALLLLMKAFSEKSRMTFLMAASVLALMQLADPRALLFLAPISFFIVLVPTLLLVPTTLKKLKLLVVYLSYLIVALALSGIELMYRLTMNISIGTTTVPVTTASIFNLNSFVVNFWYATPINIMGGISFLATHKFFQKFVEDQLSLSFSLFSAGLLFVFILAVTVPLLPLRREGKKYRAYLLPILVLLIITIVSFTNFTSRRDLSLNSLPILPRLLFTIISPESPDIIKKIAILFRTARFLNFVCSTTISLLIGIATVIIARLHTSILFHYKEKRYLVKINLIYVLMSLILVNIFLWSLPLVILGTGPTRPHPYFEISDQTMAYSNIVSQLNPYPATEKTISMHGWAGGLPHIYFLHGIEGGVKQFVIRYSIDNLFSPILKDSDYAFMAEIINKLGVKYLVVNGYRMSSDNFVFFVEKLNNSQFFNLRATANQLKAFEVLDNNPITITSSGIFVLGGYEDYRMIFPILQELTNNTVIPLFMDSPLDTNIITQFPWPLLINPHKSILDLVAPLSMSADDTIVIKPAIWTKSWDRFKNWSPGFITDTIGGTWSYILFNLPNYEWSYSYRPDYGYAWLENAHDILTTKFSAEKGIYHILARILKSPKSGVIKFKLDDVLLDVIPSKWNYNSSEFVWVSLGEQGLSEGRHILSIENLEGVNAINLILIIPSDSWELASNDARNFIQERDILYLINLDNQYMDSLLGFSQGSINILKEFEAELVFSASASNHTAVLLSQKKINEEQSIMLSKGTHQLKKWFPGFLFGTSFEEWNNTQTAPYSWTAPRDALYNSSLDPTTKVHGKYSYILITNNSEPGKWSWIRSPNIPVKPGAEYLITTNMKWRNVKQSHIVINGVQLDDSLVRLSSLPYGKDESSDWKDFRLKITIPEKIKEISIVLNAGWVYNASLGSAETWFDAISVQEITSENDLGIILLYSSEKTLRDIIAPNSGRLEIKSIQTNIYNNYFEYFIKVRVESDMMIVIPEVYAGTWRIESQSDLEIHPIPAYYILSGFYLKSEGSPKEIEITVFNTASRVMRFGEYMTFVTIGVIMIAYVVLGTTKWLRKYLSIRAYNGLK